MKKIKTQSFLDGIDRKNIHQSNWALVVVFCFITLTLATLFAFNGVQVVNFFIDFFGIEKCVNGFIGYSSGLGLMKLIATPYHFAIKHFEYKVL